MILEISSNRRKEIKNCVYATLYEFGTPELPVKIGTLIRNIPFIKLTTYSSQIVKRGLTYEELIVDAETSDAYSVYSKNKGRFCIYYNDIDKSLIRSNRVRWTLAHELGHIILRHHEELDVEKLFRSNISDATYQYFELEADYFAQLILVPHITLLGFNITTANHIKILCKISEPAARRRFREFQQWKRHVDAQDTYDKRTFYYYYNFIFKRECKNCGVGIIQRYGKYCPICGEKNTLQWGDGDKMKYPLLETHETGKLTECPICSNEETNIEGNYCQICGRYIINKCANRDCTNTDTLPSNARYCPICGGNSTFSNAGYLKAWDYKPTFGSAEWLAEIANDIEELPFD